MKSLLMFIMLAIVMLLAASCASIDTTVTAPDGTVTRTKQTILSGEGIATGAVGAATAARLVDSDK